LPNGTIFGWEFHKGSRSIQAKVEGTLTVDDIDLSIRAVLDGIGLAYLLFDYVALDIAKGRLVPLLEDWSPKLSGFYLYYSSRRQVTAPLRALIEFLKTEATRRGIEPSAAPSGSVHPSYRLVGKSHR
jgi:DNA-binding transcriptional LysR family regulator